MGETFLRRQSTSAAYMEGKWPWKPPQQMKTCMASGKWLDKNEKLLGLVTFFQLLLCLPLRRPTQTWTMSATSEGKHVWGFRKVDLNFSFFLCIWHLRHPSVWLLYFSPSLPKLLPQSRLAFLTFHSEHARLHLQLWSLSRGILQSFEREVTTEYRLTQQRHATNQRKIARKFEWKSLSFGNNRLYCAKQEILTLRDTEWGGGDFVSSTTVLSFTCSVKLLLKALFFHGVTMPIRKSVLSLRDVWCVSECE